MTRLIDADALKEQFTKAGKDYNHECVIEMLSALATIDNAPTVNPESCRECPFVADEEKQITNSDARASEERTKGDLISREALKEAIEQGEGFSWDSHGKDDLCVRKKYIDSAPTVSIDWGINNGDKTVYARPQGEWKHISDETNKQRVVYKCSECGRIIDVYYQEDLVSSYPFCHCGADMRKGAEE